MSLICSPKINRLCRIDSQADTLASTTSAKVPGAMEGQSSKPFAVAQSFSQNSGHPDDYPYQTTVEDVSFSGRHSDDHGPSYELLAEYYDEYFMACDDDCGYCGHCGY